MIVQEIRKVKMHKITIENETALFLNHCQIINDNYELNKVGMALKSELFEFASRAIGDKNAQTKRKRKYDGDSASTSNNNNISKFLVQIKAQNLIAGTNGDLKNKLPRFWEETAQFPQFHGANNTTQLQQFQALHNCYLIPPQSRFYNYDINKLSQLLPELPQFDLIIMDPPWRNKYIRRLKHARLDLAYKMLSDDSLLNMPIAKLLHTRSLVAIWCTNSAKHQQAILEEFLPAWQLRALHTLKWFKLNTSCELITPIAMEQQHGKQPYEMLYLACHQNSAESFASELKNVSMLFSVPSIVHSHKPPLFDWLKSVLPAQPLCLELFARYLQPHFISVGLEVLKLMDARLYNKLETINMPDG